MSQMVQSGSEVPEKLCVRTRIYGRSDELARLACVRL